MPKVLYYIGQVFRISLSIAIRYVCIAYICAPKYNVTLTLSFNGISISCNRNFIIRFLCLQIQVSSLLHPKNLARKLLNDTS